MFGISMDSLNDRPFFLGNFKANSEFKCELLSCDIKTMRLASGFLAG